MQEEKYVCLIVEISWFSSEDVGDGAEECDAIALGIGSGGDDQKKTNLKEKAFVSGATQRLLVELLYGLFSELQFLTGVVGVFAQFFFNTN